MLFLHCLLILATEYILSGYFMKKINYISDGLNVKMSGTAARVGGVLKRSLEEGDREQNLEG